MNFISNLRDRKKIGILGGAFDPIHLDHLKMSQVTLACKFCQEVWWIPSPDLRWDKQTFFAASDRLEMLRRVVENEPHMKVIDLEIRQGVYRGAYELLKQLSSLYPDFDFLWIMGADSYSSIPQWRDPVHYDGSNPNGIFLLREYDLICCPRRGFETPDPQIHESLYGKHLYIPSPLQIKAFELSDSSSTQVRIDLQLKGRSHSIPKAAMAYLKEKGLS